MLSSQGNLAGNFLSSDIYLVWRRPVYFLPLRALGGIPGVSDEVFPMMAFVFGSDDDITREKGTCLKQLQVSEWTHGVSHLASRMCLQCYSIPPYQISEPRNVWARREFRADQLQFYHFILGNTEAWGEERLSQSGFKAGLGLEFRSSQGWVPRSSPTLVPTTSTHLLVCLNCDEVESLSAGAFRWEKREEPVWASPTESTLSWVVPESCSNLI